MEVFYIEKSYFPLDMSVFMLFSVFQKSIYFIYNSLPSRKKVTLSEGPNVLGISKQTQM